MKIGQIRKRVVSAAAIWLILASIEIPSVFAHTVLGTLNGNLPYYRQNDHESNPKNTNFGSTGHVPGVLGYVWPGSGANMYTGDASLPPGYQSPFQNFERPLQLASSQYSPEGAIPASTSERDIVGDLVIGVNFSRTGAFSQNFTYWSMTIYVPAPFKNRSGALEQDGFEPAGIKWELGETTNIATTITDSYGNISVTKAGPLDPFGPNWWMIRIGAGGSGITFTSKLDEWYYVRLNQMRAPVIAGRYFFKIFLDDHYPVRGQDDSSSLIKNAMPAENWPVLLVKGDVDPAIVYGTVLYGGSNQTLYGTPLWLPGRVRLVGTAADSSDSLSRKAVEARGYFNASTRGHYEVEGVAPGVYDLYASSAGFPEQKVADSISLHKGQSLTLDFYLRPGTEVKGVVFAKSFGSISSWQNQYPICIVIYESDDYSESSIASYSPMNLTHAPFTSYVWGNTVFDLSLVNAPPFVKGGLLASNQPRRVAFPWEGPLKYYSYSLPASDSRDPCGIFNGVGPAQDWWVTPIDTSNPVTGLGSTGKSFIFQFGAQGLYGAPTRFSGMVPQIFATWIDGLQPRTYFVRAYLHGYVQTTSDGSLFKDYSFKIYSIEHDAGVHVQIDLYKAGAIEVTVHFHDSPGTRRESPIGGPDSGRYVVAEAFDDLGKVSALNFTTVSSSGSSKTISLTGLGMAGVIWPPDPRSGIKYSLLRYRGLRDYGISPGTQTVRIYVRGYIQASEPGDTLQCLDTPSMCFVSLDSWTRISLHMYRGGGINATVRSIDWQMPRNSRNWHWNNTQVAALIYDMASKSFIDVLYFWNSTGKSWTIPRTNSLFSSIPYSTWKLKFGAGASFLVTNGSTILERYGPALPNPASLTPSQDIATNLFIENAFPFPFLYSPGSYRTADFRSNVAIYPGKYSLTVWTYGYVQDGVYVLGDLGRVSVALAATGAQADTSVEVMQGTNFNITMIFRKEGIFEGIPHNSSVRIRIYDNTDGLVAAASTSLDAGATDPKTGFYADQKKITLAGCRLSIPRGTRVLEYRNLAGLYQYTELLTGIEKIQALKRASLFSPDYGIWGSSANRKGYNGDWTVRVDIANWYLGQKEFHPAPAALLQGESVFLFPYNHLGPYESRMNVTIPNTSLGGHASIAFGLDLRAYVRGQIYAVNWFDQMRTASWATVEMRKGNRVYRTYSFDGFYDAYLPAGTYNFRVSQRTLFKEAVANRAVSVPDGASIMGQDFYLEIQTAPLGAHSPESSARCAIFAITSVWDRVVRFRSLDRPPGYS